MSLRRFALLVGSFAIAIGGVTPTTQSRVRVAPTVTARTVAGDTVRVIVGVDAAFVPEGRLDGPLAVGAQRASMRALVNTVRAAAATAGVVSIEEVTMAAPSTYVSVPATNTPAAVAAGFTGSGWAVAVLDSGSDYTHMMLAGSVVSEGCYSSSGTGVSLPSVPSGTCYLRLTASNAAGTSAPSNQVVLVVP